MNFLKISRECKMRSGSMGMCFSVVLSVPRFRTKLVKCYLTWIRVQPSCMTDLKKRDVVESTCKGDIKTTDPEI